MKITFALAFLIFIIGCKKEENSDAHNTAQLHKDEWKIPEEAMPENVAEPDIVIGDGTPESCNCEAVVDAIANGGTIIFNCGDKPLTINMTKTAKIYNDAQADIVIDGGGLITLSGMNTNRILYMNTCDQSLNWTTSHCQNQDHPRLCLQNITLANGNSSKETEFTGGGAVWIRGGRFKMVNCTFVNNKCASTGPDVGGGAVRVFSQYEDMPVYVNNCIFGGASGLGNSGSNGGAISSIGVSWSIFNSLFSFNKAIGNGGNPAENGTPGGGSGGAIYNDGNTMTLHIHNTIIEHNEVNSYGSAIFFVTNNHKGDIIIDSCIIRNNNGGSWYPAYPQISMHADTRTNVSNSIFD